MLSYGIYSVLYEQCTASAGFEGDDDDTVGTELSEDGFDGQSQGRIGGRRKTYMEFEVPAVHSWGNQYPGSLEEGTEKSFI